MKPRRDRRNDGRRTDEFEEKVIQINRVSKKTKGGNKMSFSALMVVGDKKGKVGLALGKAPDTLSAIKKGARKARKRLIKVPMKGTTIPFAWQVKYGAAKVLLKPAPAGTGVMAGGAVRAIVESAGIRDIVTKILGSSNKASNVHATFKALEEIQRTAKKKNLKLDAPSPKNKPKTDNKGKRPEQKRQNYQKNKVKS